MAAVILSDQRPGLVTRNYVEYLTSNRLLVGAELDKVVAILLLTGLVALAVLRARSLLHPFGRGERSGHGIWPVSSPRRWPSGSPPASWSSSLATAKGGKPRSSTPTSGPATTMAAAMPPDELIALLAEYQARLVPPILTQGPQGYVASGSPNRGPPEWSPG